MTSGLNNILSQIYQHLLNSISAEQKALVDILVASFQQPGAPAILLPIATCQAVGGNPADPRMIRLAAAVLPGLSGLRILDEMRVKPPGTSLWKKVGMVRAAQYAHAFQLLSDSLWQELNQAEAGMLPLYQAYQQHLQLALTARDQLMSQSGWNWQQYWQLAERVDALPTAQLALMGAQLGRPADESLLEACRTYGHQLGLLRHLDRERATVRSDQNKPKSSPDLPQLAATLKSEALAKLAICPDEAGKNLLGYLIDDAYDRINVSDVPGPKPYQSTGLALRKQLRTSPKAGT